MDGTHHRLGATKDELMQVRSQSPPSANSSIPATPYGRLTEPSSRALSSNMTCGAQKPPPRSPRPRNEYSILNPPIGSMGPQAPPSANAAGDSPGNPAWLHEPTPVLEGAFAIYSSSGGIYNRHQVLRTDGPGMGWNKGVTGLRI